MNRLALALVVCSALAGPAFALSPSDAPSCSATSAEIRKETKAYKAAKAETDQAAEAAEAAGEAWEEVEVHRLASAAHAQTADEALSEYEARKAAFETAQAESQSIGLALNDKIASFNQRCVKKN